MAVRLVTEVMDWAPASLTHREHKVLMILAENARLPSREIWDSVEDPKILRRARLTRTQMYAVIAVLAGKKCLEKPVWGGRNHRAKYAIAHLAVPSLSQAERQAVKYAGWWQDHDQDAYFPHPENHDQCQGNRDTENHDQRPGLQDTENHDQRPRKPGPRLPVSTGRAEVPAEGAAEGTGGRSRAKDLAPQQSRKTGEITTARIQPPADDQHTPAGVQLQSQATDRYAREATP